MTRLTYCRVMRSLEATIYFGVIVSMGIVFLITYMSVELSKPLTDYWQRFLIVYQEKLEKVGEVLEEHHRAERAIRYHNEAVKDANRQIEILRAMTHSVNEDPRKESDQNLLTTSVSQPEELEDTKMTLRSETSDQRFFNGVRQRF